jgi:mono/diheme cytochrome c family protein
MKKSAVSKICSSEDLQYRNKKKVIGGMKVSPTVRFLPKGWMVVWFLWMGWYCAGLTECRGDVVVPGLSSKHPLSDSQVGWLLRTELRCSACHLQPEGDLGLEKSAPDLAGVGGRIAPEYLRRFIQSPSTVHPGTTMPDMLQSYPTEDRESIATALTHFLVAQSQETFQEEPVSGERIEEGSSLFHSVGCVACHAPKIALLQESDEDDDVDEGDGDDEGDGGGEEVRKREHTNTKPTRGISLEHLPGKYSKSSLSEFLYRPLKVRASGRMPDMKLTPAESEAIASYLIGQRETATQSSTAFTIRQELVGRGKKYFEELNCAACHTMPGIAPGKKVAAIQRSSLSRGCVANDSGKGPRFSVDPQQFAAISASIPAEGDATPKSEPQTEHDRIAMTLTAFNCIACHVRDSYGGVAEDRNLYFRGTEMNLGDDGRIPPPLTLLGAKLQPAWLQRVLFDGESVRPYITTRMPQYGSANLQHFTELVAKTDTLDGVALRTPSPESRSDEEKALERRLRPAAQELLGDKGLNCIACHNFNGKPSPLNKGIDLMTTRERLQPAWFDRFLRNPGAYRPRIIMPYSWPDGVAAYKNILDGDTNLQIEAIWYYLSLGTSAADPSGIRRPEMKLSVAEKVRTYRGRSGIAGFRGIAVGFPERLSYSFNAETGTLTGIWKGDYIRVDRGGQGSGNFNPAANPVTFAQDTSFIEDLDPTAPWPVRPVMTKEAPANPNPLYPKNLGYQFRGYYLGTSNNPTLMYTSGDIQIEDRSEVIVEDKRMMLQRRISFQSPSDQSRWFRAMTGDISPVAPRMYGGKNILLTVPEAEALLRIDPSIAESKELLLKLEIPKGSSQIELIYELQ